MRMLSFMIALLLAGTAGAAVQPIAAKPSGVRPNEYVVWKRSGLIDVASAPTVRDGLCTVQLRTLQSTTPYTEESAAGLAVLTEVSTADCHGEPGGEVVRVQEDALPYLPQALSLLDRKARNRYVRAGNCVRSLLSGSSEYPMALASIEDGKLTISFRRDRGAWAGLDVHFPIIDGKLDPSGVKSNCWSIVVIG